MTFAIGTHQFLDIDMEIPLEKSQNNFKVDILLLCIDNSVENVSCTVHNFSGKVQRLTFRVPTGQFSNFSFVGALKLGFPSQQYFSQCCVFSKTRIFTFAFQSHRSTFTWAI